MLCNAANGMRPSGTGRKPAWLERVRACGCPANESSANDCSCTECDACRRVGPVVLCETRRFRCLSEMTEAADIYQPNWERQHHIEVHRGGISLYDIDQVVEFQESLNLV